MSQRSEAELERLREEIGRTLPEAEPDILKAQINWVFDQYNQESLISRDTHPTRSQMIKAIEGIKGNLESIMFRFCEPDGGAIVGWLSGVMVDPDKKGIESTHAEYADKLTELHKASATALEELLEGNGEFEINGQPHARKTRTNVRDTMMIPMLTVIACRAGLSPANDWDDLDRTCKFVSLVLEFADIPAPDAGKEVDKRGEEAQGRLRRMIKEAARRYIEQA